MPKTNKTKYAILGLLGVGPKSGYDIKKTVDNSIGFFWSENYGHIYPILLRLEATGLVKKKMVTGRQSKNVYTLTRKGKEELIGWLNAPVEKQPIRNELLLKLFFGSKIGSREVIEMLAAEKKYHEDLLIIYDDILKNIKGMKSNKSRFWLFTLNFGISRSQMIIAWCDETMHAVKRMK
jgi:DNA-binding PadR family transcriptional regulator